VTPADGVDARLGEASVVRRFADLVRPVVEATALYAGGSLAMGDFRPGLSDLDLVAVIDSGLSSHQLAELRDVHVDLRRTDPGAAKLHCSYVPRRRLAELRDVHVTWAHGQLFHRRFDVIARAELLQAGITVFGPPPTDLIPPVDDDQLRRASHDELAGYWTGAARQPWLWWRDAYVDLGLLTLARAQATVTEGRLITKGEALTRLGALGVPGPLIAEVAARHRGEAIHLRLPRRLLRAESTRRLVARAIPRLRPAEASD
jgi:predicted nucleotidyltransferase